MLMRMHHLAQRVDGFGVKSSVGIGGDIDVCFMRKCMLHKPVVGGTKAGVAVGREILNHVCGVSRQGCQVLCGSRFRALTVIDYIYMRVLSESCMFKSDQRALNQVV
jgi:hypothetical protein